MRIHVTAAWAFIMISEVEALLRQDCWASLAIAGIFALLAIADAIKSSEVNKEVL